MKDELIEALTRRARVGIYEDLPDYETTMFAMSVLIVSADDLCVVPHGLFARKEHCPATLLVAL